MNWMKKRITNWLFGAKFVDYEKLFDTYEKLFNNYEELYKDYITSLDKMSDVFEEQKKLIDISKDMAEQNKHLLHMCNKFYETLKENGIYVEIGENNDSKTEETTESN